MARAVRHKVSSRIYHVVLRGINKQTIFFDDEDKIVFLSKLKMAKEKCKFELFAFCLMSNHIHLILRENEVEMPIIFRTILSAYVLWYNAKHDRTGSLFQDRYRSEGLKNDGKLCSAVRYVHKNPQKAGICADLSYRWSSHSAYVNGADNTVVDIQFVTEILGGIDGYKTYMQQKDFNSFLENETLSKIADADLIKVIENHIKEKNIYYLQRYEKEKMEQVLCAVLENYKMASIRQISRVTGISFYKIRQIKMNAANAPHKGSGELCGK